MESKRRILDLHGYIHRCTRGYTLIGDACPVQRLMALPYADREGYRDEWAVAE